jgi:hypothetical protein
MLHHHEPPILQCFTTIFKLIVFKDFTSKYDDSVIKKCTEFNSALDTY